MFHKFKMMFAKVMLVVKVVESTIKFIDSVAKIWKEIKVPLATA